MSIKNLNCSKCGTKLGSDKNNIADKFVYYKNGDLKYIDLFHKKCFKKPTKKVLYGYKKHNLNLLLGV
jgi:hypothetical protein|tara:strand:+ start:138 stop:341 length:204 start_codon:yes stop_codon:yes gene_type:complete